MHEYRRFVQAELDAHEMEPADLVKRSGLRRQLIWKILHDDREFLGQMPDDSTLEGLATGFGIPVARVREAAARSLSGYTAADGSPLVTDITEVETDVLLAEIKRRIITAGSVRDVGSGSVSGDPDALIHKLGRDVRDDPQNPGVFTGRG